MPEEDEDIISPVYHLNFLSVFDGTYDMLRHIFRFELQRIAAACDEVGLYEAWSDICDGDREMTHPCLLRQAFYIVTDNASAGQITLNDDNAIAVIKAKKFTCLFSSLPEFRQEIRTSGRC